MRYLLQEQPYEKPLAAGSLLWDGGRAVEHWRLTEALDGYRFLRIDWDGRPANLPSLLFHVLLNPEEAVENVRFRLYGGGRRVQGQIMVEDDALTVTREVDGQRLAEEFPRPAGLFPVFLPTGAGLTLLRPWTAAAAGLTLDLAAALAPRAVALSCAYAAGQHGRGRLIGAWTAAGGRTEKLEIDVQDPYTAPTAAVWADGRRASAQTLVHYRRSRPKPGKET